MKQTKIGAAELEILSFIADLGEATVRQVSEHFLVERGWARTTILKTMDRLRDKNLLEREEKNGVFHYRSTDSRKELETMVVDRFVKDTLGGSLSPFVAYLHGQAEVSEEELGQLKELVMDLEARRNKP